MDKRDGKLLQTFKDDAVRSLMNHIERRIDILAVCQYKLQDSFVLGSSGQPCALRQRGRQCVCMGCAVWKAQTHGEAHTAAIDRRSTRCGINIGKARSGQCSGLESIAERMGFCWRRWDSRRLELVMLNLSSVIT